MLARTVLEQAKTLDEAIKLIETDADARRRGVRDRRRQRAATWVIVERTPSKAIVERKPQAAGVRRRAHDERARRAIRRTIARAAMLPTVARVERAARLVRASARRRRRDGARCCAISAALDDAPRPPGHRGVIDDGRARPRRDPRSRVARAVGRRSARGRSDARVRSAPRAARAKAIARRRPPTSPPIRRPIPIASRRSPPRAPSSGSRAKRSPRGERERAAEACARARARAPSLPEALELEAMIAQARGDDARARTLFQQWLDGGADDPKGEERARALLAR